MSKRTISYVHCHILLDFLCVCTADSLLFVSEFNFCSALPLMSHFIISVVSYWVFF